MTDSTTNANRLDYAFSDLPEEAKAFAYSLADSLGITPSEAWVRIVENLPVDSAD